MVCWSCRGGDKAIAGTTVILVMLHGTKQDGWEGNFCWVGPVYWIEMMDLSRTHLLAYVSC